jgi:hypothetical protein
MSDFVNALQRELQRLQIELQSDPRVRRISQIKALLAEYGDAAKKPAVTMTAEATLTADATVVRHHGTAAGGPRGRPRLKHSKASTVRSALQELLQANGAVHRSAMLKYLVNKNLMGNEKNPMASLAAYLSDWKKDFVSDGKGNFSLRKSTERGAGQELPRH